MKQNYLIELKKLSNAPHVNKSILNDIHTFINDNSEFTRPENPTHHFGAFAVPIHRQSKQILLVHHKKADSWIPAGGHLEKDEQPIATVIREFKEELDYEIHNDQVKLFDISIKHVNNPGEKCQVHYDLWYLVEMDEQVNFIFDEREFYAVKWVPYEEIPGIVTVPNYKAVLQNLLNII